MKKYSASEIADIENATDLVALIGQSVSLKPDGPHFIGLCPKHAERSPSFKVTPSKHVFKCFGCGFGGNGAVDWMVNGLGMSFLEAMDSLQGGKIPKIDLQQNYLQPQKPAPVAIMPIPEDALKKKPDADKKLGIPHKTWTYRDAGGNPMFYVCRWNLLNGDGSPSLNSDGKQKKEIKPLIYTAIGWQWKAAQPLRPLYGLDRLAKFLDGNVVIVEGEKCADWAQERLAKTAATSWQGGSAGVRYTDWTPLAGRKVLLCRDQDESGWKTMEWLGAHLLTLGCVVKWGVNPAEWGKGADLADSGWDASGLMGYLRGSVAFEDRGTCPHTVAVAPMALPAPVPVPMTVVPEPVTETEEPEWSIGRYTIDHNDPFMHLGFDRAGGGRLYWYYIKPQQMTLSITPQAMGDSAFLQLAPLSWWERHYRAKSGKIDRPTAMNMLLQIGNEVGMFDTRRIRGRGAWMDQKRLVIHAGDHLLVDGKRQGLLLPSRFVYEQRQKIGFDVKNPLNKKEADQYLELCKMMNWDAPVSAYLLAGWVVIAPLCGILEWRPHLWVVGSAQVGKSTIMEYLVSRMLGEMKLTAQGLGTTEAALRQSLVSDGLPVVFDELDVDTAKAKDALANILTLIRSMSTNSGAGIIKGSGSGVATVYELRSCFALSSIAYGAERKADQSRISMLSLHKSKDPDAIKRWNSEVRPKIENTITAEFVARFQARTMALAKTILANAAVFKVAVATVLKDQRVGDQLGPLLAGAYSLTSDSLITLENAVAWVGKHQWSNEKEVTESSAELELMNIILDQIERFPVNGSQQEKTIAQLVAAVAFPDAESTLPSIYRGVLEQRGLMVDAGSLCIASGSEWLRRVLRDRAYSSNPGQTLSRLDGASRLDGGMVFAGKMQKHVVSVPLSSCGIAASGQLSIFDGEVEMPF